MAEMKKTSEPGTWHTEYDEQGNCTSTVYDASYRKLLGFETEKEFANTQNAWENTIHPDDKQRVEKEYEDCIKKHKKDRHYNIEYRMMTKWGYRWFHDYGHCIRREDGSIIRCQGVIFDIQDSVDKAEEHQKLISEKDVIEKLKDNLAQNNTRFFALEDNFESLYDVELESGNYVSYARGDFYKKNIDEKLVSPTQFFTSMWENVKKVVYKEDQKETFRVQQRDEIRKELENADHFDHYYRIVTNEGLVWLKMRIVYKDETKKNVIIGVFNAEEEMAVREREKQAREELIQTNSRLFALEDNFESLYDVELKSGHYDVYVKGEFFRENVINKLTVPNDYFADLRKNIDAVIYEEDRDTLYEVLTRKNIIKQLKDKEHFDHYYRLNTEVGPLWFKMRVVYKDADKNNIIIGVFNAVEEVLIKEKEVEESLKLINSFSASYNVAYAVDMANDSFRLLRMDDGIIGKGKVFNTFTQAKEFFISLLFESDREWMRKELDYANIRKRLKQKDSYNVEYRIPINNAVIWHEMNVTKIDDDYIAVGFANRDVELTKKHLEDRRYNEYFALYEIDLDSGMMKIIKDSPWYEIDKAGTALPYVPTVLKFAKTLDGDAREFFERQADLETIKKDFSTEDKRTFAYRSNNVGDRLWVDCTSYVTLRHRDGTPAMFTFGFSLVDSLGVYRQELQGKYKEALHAADVANQSKTNFLFNMSHDIRTPMNAIRGFTAMAKKHLDDKEKVKDYLEKIDISGEQLLKLINQVLEMARIESGKMEVEENPVDIQEEFNSLVTVVSEQAKANGICFNYSISNVKHFKVLADGARITSVMMNLLGNSMKYTPEGGSIEFKFREIHSRRPDYATFIFTVSDTGIGMSKEYLDKLYEPFSREKSSTVSKIQGTGLGLSIVKNTIDMVGGNINVESSPGKGTTFDITVDFKIDYSGSPEKEEELGAISLEGRRILLVEDNEMNREIARDILEEQGLIIDDAVDGDEAVKIIKQLYKSGDYEHYDFILMDVQMPRMNGYEASKAIRKIEAKQGKHVPIIAMTANAFEEDRQNALEAGMDDHLSKPIEIQKLFKTIGKFI